MVTPNRKIFIEMLSGERFEADIPLDAMIGTLATEFFEAQGWPIRADQHLVVELLNPEDPEAGILLDQNLEMSQSGVREGDTLRISPQLLTEKQQIPSQHQPSHHLKNVSISMYIDFDITIGPAFENAYSISARALVVECHRRTPFPFDARTLERYTDKLQIALLRSGGQRRHVLPLVHAVPGIRHPGTGEPHQGTCLAGGRDRTGGANADPADGPEFGFCRMHQRVSGREGGVVVVRPADGDVVAGRVDGGQLALRLDAHPDVPRYGVVECLAARQHVVDAVAVGFADVFVGQPDLLASVRLDRKDAGADQMEIDELQQGQKRGKGARLSQCPPELLLCKDQGNAQRNADNAGHGVDHRLRPAALQRHPDPALQALPLPRPPAGARPAGAAP